MKYTKPSPRKTTGALVNGGMSSALLHMTIQPSLIQCENIQTRALPVLRILRISFLVLLGFLGAACNHRGYAQGFVDPLDAFNPLWVHVGSPNSFNAVAGQPYSALLPYIGGSSPSGVKRNIYGAVPGDWNVQVGFLMYGSLLTAAGGQGYFSLVVGLQGDSTVGISFTNSGAGPDYISGFGYATFDQTGSLTPIEYGQDFGGGSFHNLSVGQTGNTLSFSIDGTLWRSANLGIQLVPTYVGLLAFDPTTEPHTYYLNNASATVATPEPGTLTLLGLGISVIAMLRKKR